MTDLVNLSASFKVVAAVPAAQQLQSLVHVVPCILDLRMRQAGLGKEILQVYVYVQCT